VTGYCGNTFNAGSVNATSSDCNMACSGDSAETCGGGNRLSVYVSNGTLPATTTTGGSTPVETGVAVTGLPTGWEYYGCYVDGTSGRILEASSIQENNMTRQECVDYCVGGGFTIAGLEYFTQCFCDNAIYNGGVLAADQSDCNDACGGDSTQICGGASRVSLYSKYDPQLIPLELSSQGSTNHLEIRGQPKAYAAPVAQSTGLPANWKYVGCLQ
jgi:hypothetical protein